MNTYASDENRQVIPRWHLSIHASSRSESKPHIEPSKSLGDMGTSNGHLKRELSETTSSFTVADILDVAISTQDHELASFAVAKLKKHDLAVGRALAKHVENFDLDRRTTDFLELEVQPKLHLGDIRPYQAEIHRTKSMLALNPRDPLTWMDLSWLYATSGHSENAIRAGTIAKELSPANRLISRSFARMCLHYDDGDRGYRHLVSTGGIGNDPWITAAAVAVGDHLGITAIPAKRIRRLINSSRYSPRSVSELAAGFSKLEFDNGSARNGKKLLKTSLLDPTENAIAQAAWSKRNGMHELPEADELSTKSAEATAWSLFENKQLSSAFDSAVHWMNQQPFSSNPKALALQVAFFEPSVHKRAIEIAETASRAQSKDAMASNSAACLFAFLGEPEQAARHLANAQRHATKTWQKATVTATEGLVSLMKKDLVNGDASYLKSVEYASNRGHHRLSVRAMMHWCFARVYSGFGLTPELRMALAEIVSRKPTLDTAERIILNHVSDDM